MERGCDLFVTCIAGYDEKFIAEEIEEKIKNKLENISKKDNARTDVHVYISYSGDISKDTAIFDVEYSYSKNNDNVQDDKKLDEMLGEIEKAFKENNFIITDTEINENKIVSLNDLQKTKKKQQEYER